MIISESKLCLILQIQMRRNISDCRKNFLHQVFSIHLRSTWQFFEVMRVSPKQSAKNRSRGRGCAGIKALSNGGIDIWQGISLCLFQNSKKSAEAIARVIVFRIKHG